VSITDRLDNLYKMALGASLALLFAGFFQGDKGLTGVGMLFGLVWLAAYYFSRSIKARNEKLNG
jgi:hypothetical protein